MRQSIPIDLRRPGTPESEDGTADEELSDVEKDPINIKVPNRAEREISKPSANAITPSKVLSTPMNEEGTAMFETPKVKRVGKSIMDIVEKDSICTSPPVTKYSRA